MADVASYGGLSQSMAITGLALLPVKITPRRTRFRDAKVCNNLVTDEIDDH